MSEAGDDGLTSDGSPAFSFAAWRNDVLGARERVERLHVNAEPQRFGQTSAGLLLHELSRSVEELSVAEEELRTQSDELEQRASALVAERERYRSLFEHAPVAYFVTDANGTIRDSNRAAAELVRYGGPALVGKPLPVLVQDASRRRLRTLLAQLGPDLPAATITLRLVRRGGMVVPVEANVAVGLDVRGRVSECRWLIVDQTRRRRRDRQQRRDTEELRRLVDERMADVEREQRLKDQLVATVSHEFRTGLSAIGGYADLLALGVRGPLRDEQLRDVHRIQSAYHHLTGIVDDLLSYSKIASGTMTFDMADVPLLDALNGVVDLMRVQAARKDIALEMAEVDAGIVVHADAERVRQIVLNLMGNAVKFTPSGGHVRIDVRAGEGGNTACVMVSDDGPGIPPDRAESIFQPFVRLMPSSPGTGLGLAISRDLARAMNGDLWVEPWPTAGSRFVLRLPRSTPLARRVDDTSS